MAIEIQDVALLPKDFCVFLCWQDHLDKKLYRFLIRDALNSAIARLQDDLPDNAACVFRQDSDTMNRAGSVEIANTILQKIDKSSVVIADVTPVLIDAEKGRFYPNPNVMAELGYAAKSIGWNRVVCLFNEAVCKSEQLPFDVRHRRVTAFRCEGSAQRKTAAANVEGILVSALRATVQAIGRGEIDPSLSDTALKHERDLRFLRELMTNIHRRTLDRFIEGGNAYQFHYDCLYFWYGFDAVARSCDFRFYDKELERLALELHRIWGDTMYHAGYAFGPGTNPSKLTLLADHLWNEGYSQTVESMAAAYQELPRVLNAFLDHVHDHYPEIDMNDTDRVAWERNLPYIDGTVFRRVSEQSSSENPEEDSE